MEWGRIERLLRQTQQHRRVFPDGIEQDRTLTFRDDFAHDMDAFRFQLPEMTARGH